METWCLVSRNKKTCYQTQKYCLLPLLSYYEPRVRNSSVRIVEHEYGGISPKQDMASNQVQIKNKVSGLAISQCLEYITAALTQTCRKNIM